MLGSLLRERYRLAAVLGTGGFGQTYRAEDVAQPASHPCVVKQFKPVKSDARFLETARRLFRAEEAALQKLGQHPQIPGFIDFFEEDEEFYLVQEFIAGHPLSEEFAALGRLTEADAIALLRDVLHILDFVHANRVIHRDIKPSNLIRRHCDHKIVLIDFGAVKELHTQLLVEPGETGFTVGIGTQGYTPSEQLAGQPRFCSDIYALGVTVIQAITGMQPMQLPIDTKTGELNWQPYAAISPEFSLILSRMVCYHFNQRYQSAQEVLEALRSLSELPQETTAFLAAEAQTETLPVEAWTNQPSQLSIAVAKTARVWRKPGSGLRLVAIAALAATGLVLGIRQLAGLQAVELAAYDQMMRLRPNLPADPRLLIVGITEADLQRLQRVTPSDQDVAQVIATLTRAQPRVIGLDLYRELPQEPGHAALLQQLQAADSKVVAITKLGETAATAIPPPPGIPGDRVGFNDILVDPDGVVRRNLMFATVASQPYYSFSYQVVLRYLEQQGISSRSSPVRPDYVQIGPTTFWPLTARSGGYQAIDAAGYQILLDYRSAGTPARQVSFTEVLTGQIDPSWIRDKIVLIGTIAPSGKDLFYTPYSAAERNEHQLSGVVLHAQMVSQLLSNVLDNRPGFWFVPEWAEIIWIGVWAIAGASLAWWIRHPAALALGMIAVAVGIVAISGALFYQHGWLPVVAPTAAALGAGIAVISYRAFQPQKQQ